MIKFPKIVEYYFILAIIALLTFIAGDKNFTYWRDVNTYWYYYDNAFYYNFQYIFEQVQDPFFTFLMKPFVFLGRTEGFNAFLISVAFLTITLKMISFYKSTESFFILLLLYCSYLLFLHDFIQVRVALALGLVVFSIYVVEKRWLRFLLFAVALLVHLSVFLLISFYIAYVLLGPKKLLKILPVALVIPTVILSGVIPVERIEVYVSMLGSEKKFDQINIFSTLPLLQLISLIIICATKRLRDNIYSFEFVFSALGVILFYSLYAIPIFAYRLFEMTNVFYIILLSKTFNKSIFIKVIFVLYILIGLKNTFWGDSSLFNLLG